MTAPSYRVAIVGSGPAGIYAAQHLLRQRGIPVEIDLYEKLATPWGLVRAGVAPDHPEKKQIIDRQFAFTLANPHLCFLGNVELGRDIAPADLSAWYDATIYATGAGADKRMHVPGEDLPGCRSAREFVGFYNGHPDYSDLEFDRQSPLAVVVGNGNVALDVARMLTMPPAALATTDIADHALSALRNSQVREVILLGRRGPLQAAFANAELEELGRLGNVDIQVKGIKLPADGDEMLEQADWITRRKVQTLRQLAERPRAPDRKRIVFQFLCSPLELTGKDKVEQLLISHNRLERESQGNIIVEATGRQSVLQTNLVLRAIGYRGHAIRGLPFDERKGLIPNARGRVIDGAEINPGAYVTGWIKRGSRGIIGTNRKCAAETVAALLEDIALGRLHRSSLNRAAILSILCERQPQVVHLSDWKRIDRAERARGRPQGRTRAKFTRNDDLLACAISGSGC